MFLRYDITVLKVPMHFIVELESVFFITIDNNRVNDADFLLVLIKICNLKIFKGEAATFKQIANPVLIIKVSLLILSTQQTL